MRTIKKIFNTTVSVKEGASRNILRGIVQHDTLNEVNIRLSDGSKAFDYYGYTSIIFKVLKADGTSYIDSEGENVIATSPEDGIVTVILKGQATAAAGLCQAVIEIYADGEKMTTARLNYEVFEELGVDEDAVASEDDYPVLQNLMFSMENGYVTRAEKAADEAEASAATAEDWARQARDIAVGDFATRTELDAVKNGAAPAGYGYGEDLSIIHWDDSDGTKFEATIASLFINENASKVFRAKVVDYPACIVSGNGGYADVYVSSESAGLVVYYGMNYAGAPSVAFKQKFEGVWYPWEYANPPMLVGVEYRTTERFFGKPVYVRVCDFGSMPNAGLREVAFDFTDVASMVSCYGITSSGTVFPCSCPSNSAIGTVSLYANRYGTAFVTTTVDWSNKTANIIFKYTKTTDD